MDGFYPKIDCDELSPTFSTIREDATVPNGEGRSLARTTETKMVLLSRRRLRSLSKTYCDARATTRGTPRRWTMRAR